MTELRERVMAEPFLRFAITLNGRNAWSRAISNEWVDRPHELSAWRAESRGAAARPVMWSIQPVIV
jgi:hypothetical protein